LERSRNILVSLAGNGEEQEKMSANINPSLEAEWLHELSQVPGPDARAALAHEICQLSRDDLLQTRNRLNGQNTRK
jgi:hypothetical protein